MAETINRVDMEQLLEELRLDPEFEEAFRNLELSTNENTLVALLQDGNWMEYRFIPQSFGRAKVEYRRIIKDEARAQYKPSQKEQTHERRGR